MSFRILVRSLVVASGLSASWLQAQTAFASGGLAVAATQDSATTVTDYTYAYGINQGWSGASYPISPADQPTSVTFSPVEGSDLNAPIEQMFPVMSQPIVGATYAGYTIAGDWGGSAYISVNIPGGSVPSSLSLSTTLHGGAFDGESATFDYYSTNLPDVALFSAQTFGDFTSGVYDSTVYFSGLTVPGNASAASIQVLLYQVGGSSTVIGNSLSLDSSATSYDFGSYSLETGESYKLSLTETVTIDGVGYSSETSFSFTAIPEPASWEAIAGMMTLGGTLMVRRRKGRA